MKFILTTLIVSLFSIVLANTLGVVQKVEGIVKVKPKDSIKKKKVKIGYGIQQGDIISTLRNSNAVLKLKDESVVVLGEKSTISFLAQNNVKQSEGKVYYKITSRDADNKLKIKTNFAIIGIKGTTFVIGSDTNSSYVALKEGLIGIESMKEQFILYKKQVMQQYKNYVNKQMTEFEKYKQDQIKEVGEMTKEFDLHAGKVVSFEGNKATMDKLDSQKEFEEFEKLLK